MHPKTENKLSPAEKDILLEVARNAITAAVMHTPLPPLDIPSQPSALQKKGASFVTLSENGNLRGCIGTMDPIQPLIADVQEHAVAAAMSDFRFPPVKEGELPRIRIEISRLTPIKRIPYASPEALLKALRIGVDGVLILADGRRATFLPQVWDQLPQPEDFLSQLCVKMGVSPDYWRKHQMEVYTYQVEKFSEA